MDTYDRIAKREVANNNIRAAHRNSHGWVARGRNNTSKNMQLLMSRRNYWLKQAELAGKK